jgi:pimeloyl-ACP methyl ester carboxylesterase
VEGRSWDLWGKAQVKLEGLSNAFTRELRESSDLAIGYGMGGRLLLELVRQGARWKKLVLISVHPGLESTRRLARIESDELWAQRFEREAWQDVVGAWNALGVFKNTAVVERREADFNRGALAAALRNWSLGKMEMWTPQSTDPEIEWVYGQNDHWALPHIEKLKILGANLTVVPNTGHRVGWDAKYADRKTSLDQAQRI